MLSLIHKNMHLFASKDPTRENLCVVHFDVDRRRVVASNGYVLLVAPWGKAGDQVDLTESVSVSASDWKAASKLDWKHPIKVRQHDAERLVLIDDRDATCMLQTAETKFPDYTLVIPSDPKPMTTAFALAPEYLETIGKYARSCNPRRFAKGTVIEPSGDALSPVRFTINCPPENRSGDVPFVILMPMRM